MSSNFPSGNETGNILKTISFWPAPISLNELTVMSWSIQMVAAPKGLFGVALVAIAASGCSAELEVAPRFSRFPGTLHF